MNYQEYFKKELFKIIKELSAADNICVEHLENKFSIEVPNKPEFGELSSNLAMISSKLFKLSPRKLAERISNKLKDNKYIKKIQIDGPGFINLFLKSVFWQNQLRVLSEKVNIYNYDIDKKKICIEFVSANPTGLMHIGHARGAVLGDVIASILEEVGHDVCREYYINDAGEQIKKLISTIKYHIDKKKTDNLPSDLYPGEYLKEISHKLKLDSSNKKSLSDNVVNSVMKDIKYDLDSIQISHDRYISEKKLASEENITQLKDILKKLEISYLGYQDEPDSSNKTNWKKEKMLLFKSKQFGDDKDRALIKPNGELTYFMTDIIYHLNKIKREFDELINIWGADHSGYVSRLKNVIKQIANKEIRFEVLLTGLVNLYDDKMPIKMSKRSGTFITMREVVQKVGSDALRFMMISRDVNQTIDFDFKIVKKQNKDNPVFYVQYAYARCMSLIRIFEKTFDNKKTDFKDLDYNLENLVLSEEIDIIKTLSNFHNIILLSANYYEPHRVTNYLQTLARIFHNYWGLGRVDPNLKIIIEKNYELSKSRIFLVKSISEIIKKGLRILKISCPESM